MNRPRTVRPFLALAAALALAGTALAGPKGREGTDRPAPDSRRSRERAARVMERAVAAAGGIEALRAIQDFRLRGSEQKGQNPKAVWDLEIRWRAPHWWRDAVTRSEPKPLEVAYGWDGKNGWSSGFGQLQDDSAAAVRLAVFNWTRVEILYDRWKAGTLTLLHWGTKKEDGRKWQVLEARAGDGRDVRYLLFDDATGLLGKVRYESARIPGFGREVTTLALSDYRRVGAVEWPHRLVETRKNRAVESLVLDRRLESVAFNVGLADADFARPQAALPVRVPPAEPRDPATGAPALPPAVPVPAASPAATPGP